MAHSLRVCYLRSLLNNQRITLPNNIKVTIGRNPETGVEDLLVSRHQLECIADTTAQTVSVTAIGRSFSGCNGYGLRKNQTYHFKNGDIIEVRVGLHSFEIVFEGEKEPDPGSKRKKIADFFNARPAKLFKMSTSDDDWTELDSGKLLVFSPKACVPQAKVAGFDIDGTIIRTKSGARFPKDKNDWVFNFNSVAKKLQELHQSSHKLAFFTNQSGLGKDKGKISDFKRKIEAVTAKLGLPIQVYIATGKSIYRKPSIGMWNVLLENNEGVDLSNSFYVGDAAGREKNWAPNKKKDHSKCDRLFALNLNLQFYTPEEYFERAKPAQFKMPEFDPRTIPHKAYPNLDFKGVNVIVMVGGPGSGKSHFSVQQLVPKGYVYVSRDELGTWQKCVKKLEESLENNKSVVIDNTNGEKDKRQRFVEVAQRFGVACRCFVMDLSFQHAKHNNRFREMVDKKHEVIGDMLLHAYKKNFEEPQLSEGFVDIVKIPFSPQFEKDEHNKLYRMFLLED